MLAWFNSSREFSSPKNGRWLKCMIPQQAWCAILHTCYNERLGTDYILRHLPLISTSYDGWKEGWLTGYVYILPYCVLSVLDITLWPAYTTLTSYDKHHSIFGNNLNKSSPIFEGVKVLEINYQKISNYKLMCMAI